MGSWGGGGGGGGGEEGGAGIGVDGSAQVLVVPRLLGYQLPHSEGVNNVMVFIFSLVLLHTLNLTHCWKHSADSKSSL